MADRQIRRYRLRQASKHVREHRERLQSRRWPVSWSLFIDPYADIFRITAAGICPDEPFLQRDPKSVKKCLEINTLGTYYSAQLAAAQMDRQPRREPGATAGSIVLIASIAAHRASKDQFTSDYCMSKGGVLSLTRQLGVELANNQIRVNCISPG